MVSRVLRWFPGWVRVVTEGGYPERLLNDLTAAGISVWGVRRRGEQTRFSCLAGDYRRLRPLARRACLRMRAERKHGLPFWRHRYRHRRGLLVGAVLYVVILALLAPRIWVIEVVGNTATSTAAVLAEAADHGVRLGARMDAVAIKSLQLDGPDTLSTVAFITVNPSHCVARIEVTEREPTPQIIDLSRPSDLVAARDGVILRVDARSGAPQVVAGEAVTAGTVLIAGRVETALGEKLYRAYGEVWAETTRRITVSVPLRYDRIQTGAAVCRPEISLFHWLFPLYSKTALQGEYAHIRTDHPLTVGDTVLPLGISCDYYYPLTRIPTARTAAAAEALAREQLAEQEAALFAPDSYTQLTCTGQVEQGQYRLTATYLCRENIAVEVPLE